MSDVLKERGAVVDALASSLHHGEQDLKTLPLVVIRSIDIKAWSRRVVPQTGELVSFRSFPEFVAADPLDGLGASERVLRNLCRDNPEALRKLDEAYQRGPGRPTETLDNVKGFPSGNSQQQAVRRLRKEGRTDLIERIDRGELSPHGAMVEAGLRKKTFTVPTDPERAVRALRKHFSAEDLEILVEGLSGGDPGERA